ncbi:MAG TPA: NACHT domain-containing protein [Bradyrhizobium sp.]|jgi:hypothetical protein|nr:NACHT domain-containing protein [Bradyrhizobium sp.]
MQRRWQNFEEQVRDIAARIYARPCEPGRIAGNDIDGIIDVSEENKILLEITVNFSLEKVRADINKLILARSHLFTTAVFSKCYVVVDREPTTAMIEGGTANRVEVISVDDLASSFIEYDRYRTTRLNSSFGSAIDPESGARDTISYVPVTYEQRSPSRQYSTVDIAVKLLEGKNVILLGEYGSGKSRCISEIFKVLSDSWRDTFQFSFAVNLRDCWGLRRAEEIIRRHIGSLGLDNMEASAVRAFNQHNAIFLLDGFDEVGTQSWSSDDARLRQLRAQALSAVKDTVQSSGTGTLVAGREHYFSSNLEMMSALGMNDNNALIVYVKEEFSVDEMSSYFDAAGIDVALPQWLPRRPLICQTIAQLEVDELERMFGVDSMETVFWNHFINTVCKRDARINASFDATTIYRVFVELARITRSKAANVGPISQRELQDAFEAVVGQLPVEEASVMLQRLPSLGRVGPESSDRQFIDTYILDGLRARDVARLLETDEASRRRAFDENWGNPLGVLGQKVLAYEMRGKPSAFKQIMKRAAAHKNGTLAADIVSAMTHIGETVVDFEGVAIISAAFSEFDFSLTDVRNLTITDSLFEQIVVPNAPPPNTSVTNCIAGKVAGASSLAGLPSWLKLTSVDEFDSVQTVARIRNAGLSVPHEILVAIIKKTFFQRGSGRREEALLRGFGSGPAQGAAPKVLNLLLREGLITRSKGDEGWVYSPNRSEAGRMKRMLEELRSSSEPIWQSVGTLH